MQVIKISSLSGHSPYNISICDLTRTYCYVVATGVVSTPLILNIPTELSGTQEVLVVVTDSIGCEEIQYHTCEFPLPSTSPTPTPTPTPTNITCNCISINNPSGVTLNFGFIQCDGSSFYGPIYSSTTLYVCGRLPYGDSGLVITTSSTICTGNICPGPTPTPTTTPTPTPTLPPIVGYFQDSCNPSYEFTLSNIPVSFSPLSGVYYVESTGYVGCATYIGSTISTNLFSFIAMGSQPSIYHCQISNFIYPCPTLTPTPSVTPTITPTSTITPTPTLTQTPTNTPTPSMDYRLYQVVSCCDRTIIKFMYLPPYFLPGMVVVSNNGYCYSVEHLTRYIPVTEYWNHGTTYLDCELCLKIQTCVPSPPPSFISVWVTTTPSESIILPYETTGSYSGTIDWGDGTTSINSYANRTHTYTTPGTYTITITGTLIGWSFGINVLNYSGFKLYEILQWGCLRLGNSGFNFNGCGNLILSNVYDVLNLTGVYNLKGLFTNCDSLTTIQNINNWDVSSVIDMGELFIDCNNFNDNIGGWNVSNVTNMSLIFSSAFSFNNGGSPSISSWKTSGVTDMSLMFESASSFNQPLSGWNVSNVTNMSLMFGSAILFNQNINNWDVSSVIDMSGMFSNATNFNQPLFSWGTISVNNMSGMFSNATNFNQYIGNWSVINVINMSNMFNNATNFNQSINTWDVRNVINFVNFMANKTNLNYSSSNLDDIYNGWSTLPLQSGININFGTIKYTAGGSTGRTILTGTYLWTITDGGI